MTPPTISVSATGRCEALPDQATIEATAIGTGDSAEVALASARDCAATIRTSLDAVAADQLRTTELQVEDTAEMFDPVRDVAYQATAQLEIQCAPETADQVVVDVTDGGGTVRHIEFELYEQRCRTLRDEALTAATERAREKAERIAAGEDMTITGVRDLSATDPTSETTSLVDEALETGPDANLQPSPIEVVEGVDAVYEVAKE